MTEPVTTRLARCEDVRWILELGQEVYTWSGLKKFGLPFDARVAVENFDLWLSNPHAFGVIVAELNGAPVGAIAVVLNPTFFSRSLYATEFWWGMTRSARGAGVARALAAAAEDWARQHGASHICFLVIPHRDQNKVVGMLRRRGFAATDTTWMRTL